MLAQTRRSILALALCAWAIAQSSAPAGPLRRIDPDLDPAVLASSTRAGGGGSLAVFPRDALQKTWLFWGVIEESRDDTPTLGSSTDAIVVRLRASPGALEVVRDASDPGATNGESVLNRFTAKDVDSGLEVDLSSASDFAWGVTDLKPVAATRTAGFRVEKGTMTWAQELTLAPDRDAPGGPGGPLTVGVRYWLVETPSAGYSPRTYSDQAAKHIGYFASAIAPAPGSQSPRQVLQRWDTARTIRVVLAQSVPGALRAPARHAALAWNMAMTAAIGRAPITVEESDDPTLLPGTPGCIVVYWFDEAVGGEMADLEGLGPIQVDPRTGEIVGGYVLLNGPVIRHDDTAEGSDSPTGRSPAPRSERLSMGGSAALTFHLPTGLPRPARVERRRTHRTSPTVDLETQGKYLHETLIHEIGHTLGLRHNFKGSADLAHLRPGETTASVMDYLLDLTTPVAPAPYDLAAIAYGYGSEMEPSASPFLYATDEDVDVDPDCNQFDEGDPLAFYTGKLRETRRQRLAPGAFDGAQDYRQSVGAPMRHLRRFVDNSAPERSQKALGTLLAVLDEAAAPDRKGYILAERLEALHVLCDAAPPRDKDSADASDPTPYPRLGAAEHQRVMDAVKALAGDDGTPPALRTEAAACLDALAASPAPARP